MVFTTASLLGSMGVFFALLYGWRSLALARPEALGAIMDWNHLMIVGFSVGWSWFFLRRLRAQGALRAEERRLYPELFEDFRFQTGSRTSEYISRATWWGVPLVHVRFGMQEVGQKPTFGWIAVGDRAIGLLFAFGGVAVGFCSIGVISAGVISLSAIGVGVLAVGAIGVGWWAVGAVAAGVHAFGAMSATAWEIAQGGGFVWSNYIAIGPLAQAPHANDVIAWLTVYNPQAERDWLIYGGVIAFLTLVPTAVYAQAVRQRLRTGSTVSQPKTKDSK